MGCGWHLDSDLPEHPLLARGRTCAQEARRLLRVVPELMRRVGGNLNHLPRSQRELLAAKRRLDFAFKHGKRLFKIVPVRRWATTRRHVHIDERVAPCRILAAHQNCVGVSVLEATFFRGPLIDLYYWHLSGESDKRGRRKKGVRRSGDENENCSGAHRLIHARSCPAFA